MELKPYPKAAYTEAMKSLVGELSKAGANPSQAGKILENFFGRYVLELGNAYALGAQDLTATKSKEGLRDHMRMRIFAQIGKGIAEAGAFFGDADQDESQYQERVSVLVLNFGKRKPSEPAAKADSKKKK